MLRVLVAQADQVQERTVADPLSRAALPCNRVLLLEDLVMTALTARFYILLVVALEALHLHF